MSGAVDDGCTCRWCRWFLIGDACGDADGWCIVDVEEGSMEWAPVNDADSEGCPRWEHFWDDPALDLPGVSSAQMEI